MGATDAIIFITPLVLYNTRWLSSALLKARTVGEGSGNHHWLPALVITYKAQGWGQMRLVLKAHHLLCRENWRTGRGH